MIRHYLKERKFVNDCIDMLLIQYSKNRQQLHTLLKMSYKTHEPISLLINVNDYLHKQSDIDEVNRLVREQIKINRMILTGKEMLNNQCGCPKKR